MLQLGQARGPSAAATCLINIELKIVEKVMVQNLKEGGGQK